MHPKDDFFESSDDEDMLLLVSQLESPAYRAPKRRRLDDHGGDGVAGDEEDLNSLRYSSPSDRTHQHAGHTLKAPTERLDLGHELRVPEKTEDTFYTQHATYNLQSPHRIRGYLEQRNGPASAPALLRSARPLAQVKRSQDSSRRPTTVPPGPRASRLASQTESNKDPHDRWRIEEQEAAVVNELVNIPSDIFSSPPADEGAFGAPIAISSPQDYAQQPKGQTIPPQRLVSPQTALRQTTLFGGQLQALGPSSQSQATRCRNWPVANKEEPPTHHKLDRDALRSWVYPTNIGTIRDYQYNIVARGLYHNMLVALPTGLGKTFIAATIMLNWYRWTEHAQIVFVAPTKPLVSQQVDACFHTAGIPRSATTLLTGNTPPGVRAEEWANKRVFFMTPQTILNDLKSGICDPKKVVLLVVDEAHRATGGYAYVEVVKFLRRFNTSFRVLALTATPGSTVEGVQEVIDGLGISRVEIRTEESLDIRQYVHPRKIDTILFEYSEEIELIMGLYAKTLQPILNTLTGMNAYWNRDPMALSAFGCTKARQKWMASDAGKRANPGIKGMVNSIFNVLASQAHFVELLKFHGIGPFFNKILTFQNEGPEGEKGTKYRKQIINHPDFKKMMSTVQAWVNNPDFVGHPKLEHLRSVILNHFIDAGEGRGAAIGISPATTRTMVFAHYRDSAEEIARVLKRNEPMIRPHVFVGQAHAKGSEGMGQKRQLEIIEKFKSGVYNTLVATSIGEEGLDIGEVDLIVCYDASASPIRMLQRMGRTGRKRAGNIVVLLMKQKEEDSFAKAKDNYEKMQQMIAAGTRFTFHEELSPRIVPREITPIADKRAVEIPLENSQNELPEPKKRARVPKRPPKKFHMPDGVKLGFIKVSEFGANSDEKATATSTKRRKAVRARSPTPEPIPSTASVLLTETEARELKRMYLNVGGDCPQIVDVPRMDRFPSLQRRSGHTKLFAHGKVTNRTIAMLQKMHGMTEDSVTKLEQNLDPEDRIEADTPTKAQHCALDQSLNRDARPRTKSKKPAGRKPRRAPRSSAAIEAGIDIMTTDGENEDVVVVDDDKLDSELAGFINDEEGSEHEAIPSSASSLPMRILPDKPFYVPAKSRGPEGTISDDELPDFGALVGGTGTAASDDSADQVRKIGGRNTRRPVIGSDDDDDDDDDDE